MDINDLVSLARQLKFDSISFSDEELKALLLSWPGYTDADRLSLVWTIANPKAFTLKTWKTTGAGYEDETTTLLYGLKDKHRSLIINKLLKRALMDKYKIDDYDENDFDYEDFTHPMSVELLCRTIKDDFPQLSLDKNDNTLNILNQVLRTPAFFIYAKQLGLSIIPPPTMLELSQKLSSLHKMSYESLSEEERRIVRYVNKSLLKALYPAKIPKKLPLDDMDAHHNIYLVDTFDKEHRLISPIAEVTWLGHKDNRIRMSIKNNSKKSIPFSSSDVQLVVDNDDVLDCMDCWDGIPNGWLTSPTIDILPRMTIKAMFECSALDKETIIKRFFYRQNFSHGGGYSCFSVFDFQLSDDPEERGSSQPNNHKRKKGRRL